jgi:hypothetical protein
MCPACLTSVAIVIATKTGAGAAVTAIVARARRSRPQDGAASLPVLEERPQEHPTREDCHGNIEANRES